MTFSNVQAVDGGLTATYSINSNVNQELGCITAQNQGGTACGPDFEIYAGPPAATVVIDPANWQAGWSNQAVTISGTNWSGSPSATVDVSDITLNVSPDSNGNLSGTVTIPANETATQANVTVSFGSGYSSCNGGNCYIPVQQPANNNVAQPVQAAAPIQPAAQQIPSSLPVVGDITNQAAVGCPAGTAGWTRVVARQLTDQSGKPIIRSGDTITETNVQVTNDLQLPPPTLGTALTNSQGQINDKLDFCSTQCPTNASTAKHNIEKQTVMDGTNSLGTYTITKYCTQITVQ